MGAFYQLLPRKVTLPFTPQQVLAHRTSRLRRRYANAFESLVKHPEITKKDTRVDMFVKFEKEWADEINAKTPRAIQFRSPRYTAKLSQYLMPVEKKIFGMGKDGLPASVENRLFAKGLNSFQRAKRLQAMHRWSNTVWVLLDHSRFDANVTTEHIEWESRCYQKVLAGPLKQFKWLMRQQLANRGRTTSGLRYTCRGKKMSGEYNTSLGDGVINAALLLSWVKGLDAEVLVDGDDSVIAISAEEFSKLDMSYFARNGWTTKIETTTTFEEVEFCQMRPVQIRPGNWRMVRNPWRVLNRALCTIHRYHGEAWLGYLRAVAECEWACNFGVPVLEEFAHYMMRHSRGHKAVTLWEYTEQRAAIEPKLKYRRMAIHPTARASMMLAWNFGLAEQRQVEAYLANADDAQHVQRLITGPVGKSVRAMMPSCAYDASLRRG
jgi:hypothetical protein